MKIEKPEIITEAYYIVRDPLYVCVMVDVDHRFLDFVISHPLPHEKKLNSFKCFAYHKKIYILRPREQQPKKDMLGRQVSLLLRTPPYLFDL